MDHERVWAMVGDLLHLASEDLASDVILDGICQAAVDLLDVDGAGVMVAEPQTGLNRLLTAVSDAAVTLDRVQEAMRFGPCRDAEETGTAVLVSGAEQMARWPRFAEVAASFGITNVMALPLSSRGRCWGVLSLYRSGPRPWDDDVLSVARLLADGATAHLVVSADREQARLAQVQLRHATTHDLLTGLPNRVLLHERLNDLIVDAASAGTCVSASLVDLDDFRQVNTVHGQRAGDHVLRQVAHRLDSVCGAGEFVARLGGDSFVLVSSSLRPVDGCSPVAEARERAARVFDALDEPVDLETGPVAVSARVGTAIASPDMSADELVDEADNALFDGGTDGRTDVVVRDHCVQGRRGPDTSALPSAIEDGTLAVHYQPVVAAAAPHRIVAIEALMRWHAPDGRVLTADSFIDQATRNGLMPAFGSWLVDQVCAQLATWRSQIPAHAPERVFVNLSARELADPLLPCTLAAAVGRHGITADVLGIEIVEESFVHHGVVHRLRELREAGHRLAIDDFGTGYSSLTRLSRLECDVVKIDRSLVADLALRPRGVEFMRAVVALARSLQVDVVAEGVETAEQLQILVDAGVDRVQGFLFGRPMPAADVTAALTSPGPPIRVTHLLHGRTAIVGANLVEPVLAGWFDGAAADVARAIDDLGSALQTGRPTRRWEKYLGIDLSRTT